LGSKVENKTIPTLKNIKEFLSLNGEVFILKIRKLFDVDIFLTQ
jgi:hypothetical protein